MKLNKLVLLFWLLALGCAWAVEEVIDPNNLSLKSGPTQPGEKLSIVWVESFVYPKTVKAENILSLGVRTTAKVNQVLATLDFGPKTVKLSTNDNMSWSTAVELPDEIADGVHVVRYQIIGNKGNIQRTVDYYIDRLTAPAKEVREVLREEPPLPARWPITVVSTYNVMAINGASRQLRAGQVLTSVSKMPWYKVVFDDGKEGWVPASYVKEPTEDFFVSGNTAYKAKNYQTAIRQFRNAIAVDPGYAKAYLMLAKSQLAMNEMEAASDSIRKALKFDDRIIESRVVADTLAHKFYIIAVEKNQEGRLYESIAAYRKVLELKPNSTYSWVELGTVFRKLGMEEEARNAWWEGLKTDPGNNRLRALLNFEDKNLTAGPVSAREIAKSNISPTQADDSLQILKEEKTKKGTKIEVAIRSVLSLTKSLGTNIVEKGWQVKRQGGKFMVSFICEQAGAVAESFDWLVDVDTRQVTAHNDNARLLMNRW